MSNYRSHYIKNLLFPCLAFSICTGLFSSVFITLFKVAASTIIGTSENLYATVRANPVWLPLLVGGAAVLGLVSALILTHAPNSRGGGIPTSIAAIRGITGFQWVESLFILPLSTFITFLSGVPLGTEGPCVQMGTAIGDGVVRLIGREKNKGWRRYMMTGGAASGFAMATGSPITAILFAMEEIHKRFSPLLFSIAAISVAVSQLMSRLFTSFGLGSTSLFHIDALATFPLIDIFIPLVTGLLCGICSIGFIKLYHGIDSFVRLKLAGLSLYVKFPILFALISLSGFFLSELLGTGHALIDHLLGEHLLESQTFWYLLILVFLVRTIFMMVSNTAGVTGGIFLPTLAFGAILGALCAEAFIALGLMGAKHYTLLVVIGMVSFLGASSRIPMTACVFAIEALGGFQNVLPILAAVTVAFLVVEVSGLGDFTGTVIKTRANALSKGKHPYVIEAPLTVYKDSFVIDKELPDVLWPASCTLLSIERGPNKT
ncbi:MAG: chloride channel protein, partial [Clostridia bacterium]|nr:chloride channel protein [Clostridia bacterium]